jgi:L-lactate utilization protein LutB
MNEAPTDKVIEKTLKAFKLRLLEGHFAKDREDARKQILDLIAVDRTVGIGDSSSVRQVDVIRALKSRGTPVINPFDPDLKVKDAQGFFEYLFRPSLEATVCDVFLTGTNAVTEDGRLLNIDGAGNRVAGMFWGHPLSIIVVGKNKIVKDLDEAFQRVKNVVAPEHLRRRGASSPCTITGKCHDCLGPERICAVTTIIEHKPIQTEIHVIIVNEDLGLSWSRDWPEDRIESISNEHARFSWAPSEDVLRTVDINKCWEDLRSLKGGLTI